MVSKFRFPGWYFYAIDPFEGVHGIWRFRLIKRGKTALYVYVYQGRKEIVLLKTNIC